MDYVIGVDFDNTLISYDDVIYKVALQRGLIHSETRKLKKDIRESIRELPNGEMEWQKVQAVVYGPRIRDGKLIDGVQKFFASCEPYKVRVYIISHKSEFAKFNETGTNLRDTAMAWMRKNRFFEFDGLGLSQEDVYFESTRREKIERIRYLECTHFIDDLEETFLDELFPTNVGKILYAPHMQHSFADGLRVTSTWEEISGFLFNARS